MFRRFLVIPIVLAAALPVSAQELPAGSWTAKADSNRQIGGGGSCTDGRYIYIFGGQAYDGVTSNAAATRWLNRYDTTLDTWAPLADVPYQVTGNSGAYYSGSVYSFGSVTYPPLPPGAGTSTPTYPIAKYSVAGNTWSTLATNVARHGQQFSIAMIGSKGYFTGGWVNGAPNLFVENVSEFDFTTETFTDKAAMPATLSLHSSAAHGGRVYVMGGYSRMSGVISYHTATWVYDPATDEWESQPGFTPNGRRQGRAFATEDRVYYTGGLYTPIGGGTQEIFNDTHEYDPATETWARRADFPIARHSHAAVVVGEKAYLIGGSPLTGGPSPANSTVEYTPPFIGADPVAVRVEQQVSGSAVPQGGSVYSTVRFLIEAANAEAGETVQIDVEVKPSADPDWTNATSFSSGQVLPTTWTFDFAIPAMAGYDWRWRIVDANGNRANGVEWNDYEDPAVTPDFIRVPVPPPPAGGGDSGGGGSCGGSATGGHGIAGLLVAILAIGGLASRK